MTQVVLDAALRGKLKDLSQPLELCDESGKILARLYPVLDPSLYEGLESPISKEELQRRKRSKSYTTAEVLGHLEKL